MSRHLTRVWPLLVLVCASEVGALGLGDIRLSSALNEPLRAEIELISATPEELDNLDVLLASSETFTRYGLDRPLFLQGLRFRVIRSGGTEGNVVTVTSREPVTEPFVTFLVEATWSRGRLLREYTVLLDPPTFAPPPVAESTTPVTAPRQAVPADSGRIEREPEPQPAPPQPAAPQPPPSRPIEPAATHADQPPPAPESFDTTAGGDYVVQRGQTLWRIATDLRPDSRLTMNQTMLAIFQANPEAFGNNVNMLRAGARLRIPSADEIFQINRAEALAEVQRQHAEWGGSVTPEIETQPSLTLVPPDDVDADYDTGVSTDLGDDTEVAVDPTEQRIRDIEDTLAAHQDSLIEIQDDELAALRAELARLRGEEYIEPDVVDDEAAIDDEAMVDTMLEPDIADDTDIMADDTMDETGVGDMDAADDTADDSAADTTTTTAPPVVTTRTRPEPGLIDRAIEFLSGFWGILIGGLLVVLGVLVWFARRAAKRDDEESTGVWSALDADQVDRESAESTERLRALAREDDEAIVVVEQEGAPAAGEPAAEEPAASGTFEAMPPRQEAPPAPVPAATDALEATDERAGFEDTFSSETAINLDQSDPVAEADFHMAYGLYDQAADLINGALEAEPERQDLLAKLCEIYFVWGNRDAFVDAAVRLRTVVGGDSSPEWDKIVIMGQQIAPDHEMFFAAGAAPTREVDLSFEGALDEESDLDMDLAAGTGESEIIDLGEQEGEAGEGAGLDMVFETGEMEGPEGLEEAVDQEPAEIEEPTPPDETGETAQMPAAEASLADTTGEVPALDASGEAQALEEAPEVADIDETADVPAADETGLTAEMPTAETPLDATGEAPTIEQQFEMLERTGELPALSEQDATELAALDDTSTADIPAIGDDEVTRVAALEDTSTADVPVIGDDEVTRLASLDEEDEDDQTADATGEIEIDDLGLDIDSLADTGLRADLDDTAERAALSDDDLDATGTDETREDQDTAATGLNTALDESAVATGMHPALDADDALAAASETDVSATDETSRNLALDEPEDTDVGVEIDTSLLDATGQTQVLTDDMSVDTASEIEDVISDDERTLLAAGYDDEETDEALPADADTLLAPLDDEESADESTAVENPDEEFDFAKTEALPKDVFTGMDPVEDTGELAGIAETDMDLDLEDLTAALRVSNSDDTVDQPREDATVEYPRPSTEDVDLDVGEVEADDEEPTARLAPEEVSGDLHDARTMTEVGTKLDLARAYVDMGDPGGARSILEEVLDEGDDGQKQQAQQLLDSLPG
jgi:pilus assembly protein FimV